MPERTAYAHGTPCWVDLSADDVPAACAFYGDLLGWTARDTGMGGYVMFDLGDKAVAAAGPKQAPGTPSVWTTYFATDDAAATTEAVSGGGGTVMVDPMEVADLGTMAVYVDPTGAVFGVWQAGTFAGAELVNEPGTLMWNQLATRDPEAASAFYAAALGLQTRAMEVDGRSQQVLAAAGDERPIGGLGAIGADSPAELPSHWGVTFAVADTDGLVATVADRGGAVSMPGMDSEFGRFAVLTDPEGATFGVIQPGA